MSEPASSVETERLLLRPVVRDDADALLDIFSRPEVARWSGDGSVLTSLEQAHAKIERYRHRGGGRVGQRVFAIVPAGRGELVGVALLVPLPASRGVARDDIEIGWHLHPDVWGRGYATEAGRALVRRAWELGIDELRAVTRPDNVASQAVCRRLGMADLGLRDDWYDVTTRAFALRRDESRPPADIAHR